MIKATQRGLGTLVGVATATALLDVIGSRSPIIVIVLIATFGAVAFYSANYMIYSFFLTNAVLLYYWLAVDGEVGAPVLRLAATVIGIVLAFGGMALVAVRKRKLPAIPARELDRE